MDARGSRAQQKTRTESAGGDVGHTALSVLHARTHATLYYIPYYMSDSLCLSQYPPGYLEAMANKSRKEASVRGGRGGAPRGKRHGGRGRPRCGRPPKRVKEEEEEEREEEEEEPAEHEDRETQRNGEEDTQKDAG